MKTRYIKILIMFLMPVALFIICALISPGFGLQSISVVLSQSVIPVTLGYGIAFTNAAGIFDLSAGARVILSAAAGGYMAAAMGLGMAGMIIGSIAVGLFVGVIMGLCHNLLKIPSLILSLGFVMLIEVVGSRMLGHSSFIKVDSSITFIGKAPYKYAICLVLAVIFYMIYYHTKFSSHVRLIGENELLAKNMGIKPSKVNFQAFVIGSVFLGIVGILQLCYAGSISSTLSMGSLSMVFQPLMGVMIGMKLLVIFDNLAVTIVIGELCISILYNMIIGMGIASTMQNVLLGFFMIIVMSISANKDELSALWNRIFSKKRSLVKESR